MPGGGLVSVEELGNALTGLVGDGGGGDDVLDRILVRVLGRPEGKQGPVRCAIAIDGSQSQGILCLRLQLLKGEVLAKDR